MMFVAYLDYIRTRSLMEMMDSAWKVYPMDLSIYLGTFELRVPTRA